MRSKRLRYLAYFVVALIIIGMGAVARLWGRVPLLFTQLSILLLAVYAISLVGILRGSRLAIASLLVLAVVVMVGNTLLGRHLEVLEGVAPPMDTFLLSVTAYGLQIPIAAISALELRKPSGN